MMTVTVRGEEGSGCHGKLPHLSGSSAAERAAVNRVVAGSIPAPTAMAI